MPAAVEQAHLTVAEIPQKPPEPCGPRATGVVIGHEQTPRREADARQRGPEIRCRWQGVPATRGCSRTGEIAIEVEEVRAGHMALCIGAFTGAGITEGEPAIDHDRRIIT